jgi:DNA-directed RNA polymerase specialized sigma24 family protein
MRILTSADAPVCGVHDGDWELSVERAWAVVQPAVACVARELASSVDEQEDLRQEALIRLWQVDPSRFDLRDREEVRYLRRVAINRMRDVWRGRRPYGVVMHELTLESTSFCASARAASAAISSARLAKPSSS